VLAAALVLGAVGAGGAVAPAAAVMAQAAVVSAAHVEAGVVAQDDGEQPVQETARVGDPASTRRVYLVIVALLVLAAAIVAFTVWFWRSSRPEPPALGRLEAMGLRRWEHAHDSDRQRLLDDAGDFVGGDGPVLDPAEVGELVPLGAAAGAGEHERDHEGDWDDELVAAAPDDEEEPVDDASLAELVGATPQPTLPAYGGSIGDPAVLRALGLDDEALGLFEKPGVDDGVDEDAAASGLEPVGSEGSGERRELPGEPLV
jgi:hypothetical protein